MLLDDKFSIAFLHLFHFSSIPLCISITDLDEFFSQKELWANSIVLQEKSQERYDAVCVFLQTNWIRLDVPQANLWSLL